MPIAKIQVRKSRPREEKQAMMAALHAAMQDALGTPESARQMIYLEYPASDFEVPSANSEGFTLVEITMFAGRSMGAKKKLYQEIVRNFGALGIKPLDVFIVIHEAPRENWSMGGGVPASEIDLGFKVDV